MSIKEQLKKQAIPKFKNHYVRYFDLEQISRESVEETRALGEGSLLRYLRASHARRIRSPSRGSSASACSVNPAENGLPPSSYFAKALEQELHRVRRYVEIFLEEIWVQLGSIVESLAKSATPRAVGETLSTEDLDALTIQCNDIGSDIVLLDEFLRQNVVACAFLMQKHEGTAFSPRSGAEAPQDPHDLSLLYIQAMEQILMSAVENGTIVVNLSDIYSQIRQLRAAGNGGGWYTPKAGGRESQAMKFWIHPGDVLKLKCEVIKSLPISANDQDMYTNEGRQGKKLSFLKDESLKEWHQVKSVYFDDGGMQTFLAWMENSLAPSVVRASWYGGQGAGNDNMVYLAKRYKENQAQAEAQGQKEFVGIEMRDFENFLMGRSVTAVEGEIRPTEWLADIQKRLATRHEFPCFRAESHRTVFEEAHSSEVMMSLDTHVCFTREREMRGRVVNPFSESIPMPNREDVDQFPYAILEVEQSCEITPKWLKDLEDTGLLVAVPNFSKYEHGATILFPEKVHEYPAWFVEKPDGSMVPGTLEQVSNIFGQESTHDSEVSISLTGRNGRRSAGCSKSDVRVATLVQDGHADMLNHVLVMEGGESDQGDPVSRKNLKLKARPIDNDSAKESSQSGGASGGRDGGMSFKLTSWMSSRKKNKNADAGIYSDSEGQALPKAPALVRTRIEPKTFFANERTFLSWLSIAVLVMFMGLSLLGGSNLGGGEIPGQHTEDSRSIGAGHVSGALIAPIAIVLLVYALIVYRKRSRQILRRETVRYDDQKGPILITVLLIIVLVMAYGFSIKAAFGEEASKTSPVPLQP